MPPRLSVVICTHNPRPQYFQRVLEALRQQTLSLAEWELIVVDNQSHPPLATSTDVTWHTRARVVREEKVGLTHARLRGFAEASSPLVIYVDDDNVLDSDYLATAAHLADTMPFLGVWSASIQGEFEIPPTEWMKPYFPYLALTDFTHDQWSNHPRGQTLPIGAGMVVRREVMTAYRAALIKDPRRIHLDRDGQSLLAGGDTDIGLAACSLGLGCSYMTALRVTHLIPANRLQRKYLTRLVEDITASHHWLDLAQGRPGLNRYTRIKLRIKGIAGYVLSCVGSFGFDGAVARGHLKATTLYQSEIPHTSRSTP